MNNAVDLETKFKVEYLIRQIAKREYPLVFVVEENTEAERFIDAMVHQEPPERWREIAREVGIPTLDGRYVVENFRGEMAPEAEGILKEEVIRISAAKQGMVVLHTYDSHRLKISGQWGEAPLAVELIPVEELTRQDIDRWSFSENLEALAKEIPVPFVIPPTDRVEAYLKENGKYVGGR